MDKFELDACRKWIEDNRLTCVALQVPDDDLDQVQDLIDQLTTVVSNDQIEFYLVGDGCSPCCNDLINAQYCQAQGLIHFGHSCLTSMTDENSPKIAIFYVFYQQKLPDEALMDLGSERKDGDKPYSLVFYDPCYRDTIEEYSKSSSCPSHLIFSKIDPNNSMIYGRSYDLPLPLEPSNYSVIFISHSKASLHNFALHFYAYEFRSYPSSSFSSQRLLSKRMYAIECARNGSSFGLLLSSNSLLNLPTTIHRLLDYLKSLLKKNERSYYTLLMNTLSISKMNNFEKNIDLYVLCSSCSESLWLSPEHKQFNIPLISVMDVIQAFHSADDDDDRLKQIYSFDLREILSTMKSFVDEEQFSANDDQDRQALILKHPNALLLQQRDEIQSNRTWWGLQISNNTDQEKEISPIAQLKEGKFGVASGYSHETK